MTFLVNIADRVLNRPLLIMPEKAAIIVEVLAGRIGVNTPEASRFEGQYATPENGVRPFKTTANGVGVLSIVGTLINRGAYIGASSGLVSYEGIQHQLKALMAAPDIHSVILDIQSPGGEAIGTFETAVMVRQLAETKHVVALVNGMAASAAYSIASGASEIVTIETGISGSIGVVLLHADYSRQLANEGIEPTFIFAGSHKVDANPFEPLSDNARTDLQMQVNAFYEKFLETVALGRGDRTSIDMARATEARSFMGQAAIDAGLADRIGTFESVLEDLSSAPLAGRTNSQKRREPMSEKTSAPAAETKADIPLADHEQAVTAARAEGLAEGQKLAAAEKEKTVAAERERIAAITALARPGAEAIISASIADGSTKQETAFAIMEAGIDKNAARLTAMQDDESAAAGAMPAAEGNGTTSVPHTTEGWKAEWAGSDKLQAEFVKAEHYAAFKKHEAGKGRV